MIKVIKPGISDEAAADMEATVKTTVEGILSDNSRTASSLRAMIQVG